MASPPEHISCQQVVEVVTEYLEGALSPTDAELFEQHLNFCEGCRFYVDEMRRTVAAGERLREEDVPAEMMDSLLASFRARSES